MNFRITPHILNKPLRLIDTASEDKCVSACSNSSKFQRNK